MAGRYAPIPTAQEAIDNAERQMEDAFDVSDDEGEETRPMIPSNTNEDDIIPNNNTTNNSNLYNFEFDYTMPPPGSPPRPSALALPNNVFGNSNGYVPDTSTLATPQTSWFQRNVAKWNPLSSTRRPAGPVGSGNGNDGVFANLSAKPTASSVPNDDLSRAEQGGSNNAHIVPEFEQKDVPPTYADAQRDAVPPYWDTTVLAPAGAGDDMLVEGFPPGHVFSFVTSLFISFSFQFIGFMLTSILATTHAAKFGSRAGLGITLVQYGFYLRGNVREQIALANDVNGWPVGAEPHPTFTSAPEANAYYSSVAPLPTPSAFPDVPSMGSGDYALPSEVTMATDWLSFFLMTIGWLLFLTSLLGYWRIKRWERSLRSSSPAPAQTTNEFPGLYASTVREGVSRDLVRLFRRMPQGTDADAHQTDVSQPVPQIHPDLANDPEARRRYEHALAVDRQIETELRRSGLL
ncbi:hypothetical protein M408DRAFT_325964 [Serendipita vermifera MAFF 305830]|uniref:Metal homeostatis protein bsd2 n=1 Tax=Serendipita vermifera MAFF 305830 TaxID=933852 RepID=A0A0C3BNZ7_SERVB|nr:hypothetical protein M408DRAFT_325964 [Serendipita vermifera MAFF 305830]